LASQPDDTRLPQFSSFPLQDSPTQADGNRFETDQNDALEPERPLSNRFRGRARLNNVPASSNSAAASTDPTESQPSDLGSLQRQQQQQFQSPFFNFQQQQQFQPEFTPAAVDPSRPRGFDSFDASTTGQQQQQQSPFVAQFQAFPPTTPQLFPGFSPSLFGSSSSSNVPARTQRETDDQQGNFNFPSPDFGGFVPVQQQQQQNN
jgi:hypothetical protein